jgi:hypothetical protein
VEISLKDAWRSRVYQGGFEIEILNELGADEMRA